MYYCKSWANLGLFARIKSNNNQVWMACGKLRIRNLFASFPTLGKRMENTMKQAEIAYRPTTSFLVKRLSPAVIR